MRGSPNLLVSIASALGIVAGGAMADALVASLRDRRALIILDCCEHVMDAVAPLAERISRDGVGVHVLATRSSATVRRRGGSSIAAPAFRPRCWRGSVVPFVTSREGGSGIGFAVARGVIEHHGGVVRVSSETRVGTTVSIWLPAPSGRSAAVELVAMLDDLAEALKTATHQVGWLRPLGAIRAELEYGVLGRSYVDEAMLTHHCREVLDLLAGDQREFADRYASARASSPAVQSLHDRTTAACRRAVGDRRPEARMRTVRAEEERLPLLQQDECE
jgi:hypothetical protein